MQRTSIAGTGGQQIYRKKIDSSRFCQSAAAAIRRKYLTAGPSIFDAFRIKGILPAKRPRNGRECANPAASKANQPAKRPRTHAAAAARI
jgi:hypothetical protein